MKKLTSATLLLVFTAGFLSLAKADDSVITISKASDTKAKVVPFGKKDPSVVVPITFDSGADWTSLKDSYTVSPGTNAGLLAKKDTISIGADGTATFHSKKK